MLPRVIFCTGYFPMFQGQKKTGSFIVSQQQALEELGVTVWPFYVEGPRFLKYPLSLGRFQSFVREHRADLVHAHYSYNGALALSQRRLPVVVSLLGGDVFISQIRQVGEPVRAMVTYVLTQATAALAKQVIVKSEAMARSLWRKRGVHVIPNGINLATFAPMPQDDARKALGLALDKKYILFPASRTRPEKDFPLAEAAYELVRARARGVELLTLEAVPPEQVPHYLNAADVVLFTSRSEGAPNVIKEAMACNTPIVTVEVGDTREVVEGTASCWVTPRDPQVIAGRLLEALASGARSDGRERIQPYDWRNVSRRLLEVYHACL